MTKQHPSLESDGPAGRGTDGVTTGAIDPVGSASGETLKRQVAELTKKNVALQETVRKTQDASRAKSEFVANMIREIRTPLAVILGFAENMESPDQSESDRTDAIKTIRHHAELLRGMVDNVLDLSKLETGKMVIEQITCDPIEIIARALSHARIQSDTKGLPLEVEFDGAIPVAIRSDPTRIRQILVTLLSNAVKFTQSGKVRLIVSIADRRCDNPLLQVDVVDTGEGMTPEQTDRLFKPFARGYSSTTRRHSGSGMGLAICKRLTRLLGGDICLVETEPGHGSRFRATVATGPLVDVPMHDDPQASLSAASTQRRNPKNAAQCLGGCRILLVEDGPDNQRLLEHILTRFGAHVTLAGNGKIAVQQVLQSRSTDPNGDSSSRFHVILMDMQMPVMDGFEATHRLRREGHGGPIIALTAYAMSGDRDKCLRAGCDDYLAKPIERQELINTVATHFAKQVKWVMPDHTGELLVSDLADDVDMLRLIEMFVEDLAQQIARIDQAMCRDDVAALAKLADQLRSSAGSHGFAPITAAADELASCVASVQSVHPLIPQVEALVILCKSAVAVRKTPAVAG